MSECCCSLQDLADSVSDMSKANDWFLVAPDFTDYMRAQVILAQQFQLTASACAHFVWCNWA